MSEGFKMGPPLIMMDHIILMTKDVGVAIAHARYLATHMDGHLLVCQVGEEEFRLNIQDEFVEAAHRKGVPFEDERQQTNGPQILLPEPS